MANTVVVVLLSISLVITAVLATYTLLRCDSRKSASFIAVLSCAFLYILGYLLQTIAGDLERATLALLVTFLGAVYIASAYLYFVAEYCEVQIKKWISVLLVGIPLVYTLLLWTTGSHQLILILDECRYITDTPVWYLAVAKGPLYYLLHAHSVACLIATIVLVVPRLSVQVPQYRANLIMLMGGATFFIVMDVLFLLKITPYGVNLVHSSTIVLVLLLYYCIMRYNLMDITPIASEMALSSVRDAFILVGQNNRFLRANDAACRIFPQLRDMEKGSPISQIKDWPAELALEGGSETVAFSMGEENYYTASLNSITSQKSKSKVLGYIIIIQDITETIRMTKKLEEFAYTDSLTGIYNRRHVMSLASAQFERMRRAGGEAYVVLFDVDHFKRINDTHGHIIGDEVLKAVVDRIRNAIRPYDVMGRYGGEEFMLFVPDISEEDIRCYVERLRQTLCDSPVGVEGVRLTVTASFGAARILPENGLEMAIKVADEALYTAKRGGRNKGVVMTSGY